jgi:tetraacyldisaccharide 4'-kinase
MREPAFWYRPRSLKSQLFRPLSVLYGAIAERRMMRQGFDCGIPVLCVGNYHVGGAGKTPTVLALVTLLRGLGEAPVVLSRGYGGRLRGPVMVAPERHTAEDVGDEPLMMARDVPVVVARDRLSGVALAKSQGASVILMDDGFQSPGILKNASLIVIDSTRGIGNGKVFPAGPLRAPLKAQMSRTDALVIVGDGHAADDLAADLHTRDRQVFRARLKPRPDSVAALQGRPVLAFAGIGDPARFFRTLTASGIKVAQTRAFADHHVYSDGEIDALVADARREQLMLVTTEKDLARLGPQAVDIVPFAVTLEFDDPTGLRRFVSSRLFKAREKQFAAR